MEEGMAARREARKETGVGWMALAEMGVGVMAPS